MSAVAEHEAELIRDRTRRALAAAKLRGVRLGGDRGNLPAVAAAGARASAAIRRARAERTAMDLRPLLLDFSDRGLSYRAIARELDARAIPTARGRPWGVSQAFRLMQTVRGQ